jgi:hypothetical protein
MRRIQIYLDESVDEALQSEAARTGRSKASLIRECVSSRYGAMGTATVDSIDELIGSIDVPPAAVDDVVYGAADDARRGNTGSRRKTLVAGSPVRAR